jgi:hypothetical protein
VFQQKTQRFWAKLKFLGPGCVVRSGAWCVIAALSSGTAEPIRSSLSNATKTRKRGKMYRCGGAEKYNEGDGDAAATVAHTVKRGDGEEEENVDAAAAFSRAVAFV